MSKRIRHTMSNASRRIARFGRAEDGSFIVLSLFLFLTIILIGGIGVDILRHDYARVRLQNVSDAAALAAADLDQQIDAATVVNSHFDAAGILETLSTVSVSPAQLNRRQVSVSASTEINTWFMSMVGVNKIAARTRGSALEEVQDVEISLVLDVSGSMEGTRLTQLKTAAKKFVNTMLTDRDGQPVRDKISISIVPYSAQVTLDDHILSQLSVVQEHDFSNCLEFRGSQFETTEITGIGPIRQHAHVDPFSYANADYDQRLSSYNLDCSTWSSRRVTLLEDRISVLESRIDALTANGNTSTEFGLKVGAALLDPSMRSTMTSHPDVRDVFQDRPFSYERTNTLKVVVVMSDGQNTVHKTFAEGYDGDAASDTYAFRQDGRYYLTVAERERGNVDGDSNLNEPGYYPVYDFWGSTVHGGHTASRLTWQDLFGRVSMDWHAWYARAEQAEMNDDNRKKADVYDKWMEDIVIDVGKARKDTDTKAICDAIKAKDILVYSIAFEISEAEATLLKACATNENLHYNVSGNELNYAFSSIATSLNSLQLVQ